MPADTIPERLLATARRFPDHAGYHVRRDDGGWDTTSWATFADEVRTAARALIALGLAPGGSVCVLGYNQPAWVIVDHAAMMAGGVPAGIYTTCSPEEVRYIVDHCEASIVLLEDAGQWAKIDAERARLPHLRHVVMMPGVHVDDPLAMTWEAFLARAEEVPEDALDARRAAITPETPGTYIYTSGTTGPPKAVVLTHDNLAHTATVAVQMVGASETDRMVSYLPLSHIAEQMFTIHGPASSGIAIYYARSLDTLLDDMQASHPTILFAVPRVWEKMHARLSGALGAATGLKAAIARWAMGVGRKVVDLRNAGKPVGGLLALQYGFASKRVFEPIKQRLGLDAARMGISGAAPISPEILQFFASLDIVIHEVYGQSEGTGPTSFNLPGRTRFGSVGPAIPGTTIRIADDGEILVKGRNVFAGYLKDPAATAETLVDGWLHSGDLGEVDSEGFLRITGRKKEILITAGGKNIAPKNIEAALKDLPLVSQAVVIGDRRPYLTALLTLDPEAAAAFAEAHGLPGGDLHAHDAVREALQAGIDAEVNPRFARVEHVRKFAVLPRDFTIDDGELTPTLKIKRRIVDANWADAIAELYAS
ncbi:MAG: AMP-binding protein [Alphaproteobacteria bacterium]|nr:AMP-binding protein [Alphaproteobacteria bacterium]